MGRAAPGLWLTTVGQGPSEPRAAEVWAFTRISLGYCWSPAAWTSLDENWAMASPDRGSTFSRLPAMRIRRPGSKDRALNS